MRVWNVNDVNVNVPEVVQVSQQVANHDSQIEEILLQEENTNNHHSLLRHTEVHTNK